MSARAGKEAAFCFDPGPLDLSQVERLAAGMWSDLAFDEQALERLRRDGLTLTGVRLTGPSPFLLRTHSVGQIQVRIGPAVTDPVHAELLLDLWRLHFLKGMRPGSLTA